MTASIRQAVTAKVDTLRLAHGITAHRRSALESAAHTFVIELADLMSVLPGRSQRTAELTHFARRVLVGRSKLLRASGRTQAQVTADLFEALHDDEEFLAMLVALSREPAVER